MNNTIKQQVELTPADIERSAPSVFALSQRADLSEKYQFIPTSHVLETLAQEGWKPYRATQSRCKNPDGAAYVKHLLRLRNPSLSTQLTQVGDTIPELVVTNSHNGTSAFHLNLGLFRLACTNGLVVSAGSFASASIRHVGFRATEVITASRQIISAIPSLSVSVQRFQVIDLKAEEQIEFARQALAIRYDNDAPVTPERLLREKRRADYGNDLWRTFNRVQENLVVGGLRYEKTTTHKDVNGGEYQVTRSNSTRAITAVDANLTVNRKLWELLDIWAQKKA